MWILVSTALVCIPGYCLCKNGRALDATINHGASPPGTLVSITISQPPSAQIYGFSVGHSFAPSVGVSAGYRLTGPKEGEVRLHEYGIGFGLGIPLVRHGFPFEVSVVGSGSFMTASGLPDFVFYSGHGYVAGLRVGRAIPLGSRFGVGVAGAFYRTFSSSALTFHKEEVEEHETSSSIYYLSLLVSVDSHIAVSPEITFGKNLSDPGVTIIIRESITFKVDVADVDGTTTVTYSFGLIF